MLVIKNYKNKNSIKIEIKKFLIIRYKIFLKYLRQYKKQQDKYKNYKNLYIL